MEDGCAHEKDGREDPIDETGPIEVGDIVWLGQPRDGREGRGGCVEVDA